MAYYWGKDHQSVIEPERNFTQDPQNDWGNENAHVQYFKRLKEEFIDRGIPILMGEYGAFRRSTPKDLATHNDAIDYWITFVTKEARSNGILDRQNNTIKDQRTIDAIIAGGE
jgi:hypothetical protein